MTLGELEELARQAQERMEELARQTQELFWRLLEMWKVDGK